MSDPGAVRVAPQTLLEGVERALREQVLPHLESRTARGQLWAAIDVLRNLAGRVEPSVVALEEESRSIESVLRALASQARADQTALAGALESQLAAAPPSPPGDRSVALRALLRDALARLDALPPERGEALRALLGPHLAAQAVRDLSRLKGSLLEEISRG